MDEVPDNDGEGAGEDEVVVGSEGAVAGSEEVVAGDDEVVAGDDEVVAGDDVVVVGVDDGDGLGEVDGLGVMVEVTHGSGADSE